MSDQTSKQEMHQKHERLQQDVGFWEERQDDARRDLAAAEQKLRVARAALERFESEHEL